MSLDAILKQYQNNTKSKASKKQTSEERLKQYFTTFLPEGVQTLTKKIRLLPAKANESEFKEVMGHKAQVGGQWRTFICPKHERDEDCPFCQAREALLATGESSDKELAKSYYPKRMYVVKVIDRAHEDEGPKFWRFNHDFRKTGIFDKIMGVVHGIGDSAAPDMTDVLNGRDLIITINRDQKGNPTVSSIVQGDPSPLHKDEATAQSWLADERNWEDVYSIKPYSYLEIIVKGGDPVWKKDASGEGGQWVDKNTLDLTNKGNDEGEELSIGNEVDSEDAPIGGTNTSTDETDDLPF